MLDIKELSKWINKYLNDVPSNAIAINFNIYESEQDTYDIQLIATDVFDEDDEDWACEEIFSTKEDLFTIHINEQIKHWEDALAYIKNMIEECLKCNGNIDYLKNMQGIGVGFVDGDIELINLHVY